MEGAWLGQLGYWVGLWEEKTAGPGRSSPGRFYLVSIMNDVT